jgi:hypothetical protein
VHPIDSVYRRIVAGVLKMALNQYEHEERAGNKRRREGPETDDQHARRPREGNYSRRGDSHETHQEDHRDGGQRPREYDYLRRGRDEYEYEYEFERGDTRVRRPRRISFPWGLHSLQRMLPWRTEAVLEAWPLKIALLVV